MLSDETTSNIEPRRRRISADSFRTGRNISNLAQGQQQQLTFNSKLVNNVANVEKRVIVNERKITILKNILGNQKSDLRENLKAVSPQTILLRNLDEIIKTLREEAKLEKREKDNERKNAENRRRRLRENKLEKRYEGLRKTTERILAPVKGVLDRIFQALIAIVGGKFLVGLISFITNPKNKEKINSAIRFFSDFGPKLLAAYLLFGTRFGRSLGRLSGFLIRGAIRLAAATASLLAKIGIKRAAGVATGLLGPKGKALGTGLQIATAAAGFLSLQNFLGGGGGDDEAQGLYGGGVFRSDGLVDGPYGYDKVNARLTDGEFVMSAPAVAAIGPSVLERINAKYGGDNTPRMVSGKVFANEGGLINFAPGLERLTAARTGQAGLGYYLGQINPAKTIMTRTEGRSESSLRTSSGPIERRLPTSTELSAARKARGFLKPGQMSGSQSYYRFPETGVTEMGYRTIERGDGYSASDSYRERTMGAAVGHEDLLANKKQLMSMFPQGTTLQNILNYNVRGMSPLDIHRAFVSSDAYKATRAKEAAAEQMYNEDLTAMGVDISRPYTDFEGVIKQDGKVFANTGIFGFNKPKVMTPQPPAAGQAKVIVMNDSAPQSQEVPTPSSPNITIPSIPLPGMNRSKAVTLQVGV